MVSILKTKSVHPELVEGFQRLVEWFDRLTMNGEIYEAQPDIVSLRRHRLDLTLQRSLQGVPAQGRALHARRKLAYAR